MTPRPLWGTSGRKVLGWAVTRDRFFPVGRRVDSRSFSRMRVTEA